MRMTLSENLKKVCNIGLKSQKHRIKSKEVRGHFDTQKPEFRCNPENSQCVRLQVAKKFIMKSKMWLYVYRPKIMRVMFVIEKGIERW